VTRLPLLHAWITYACMQTVINLSKERKLKNLPGKAEGDGAHDWLFSLGGEETSHDWGTGECWPQEHDGGEEGYLLAGHSPLFLLIFTGSPCSGFLLRVPSVLRWDSCFNGGLLDVHRMEELLGLVQLRGQDKDEGDDRLALAGRCLLPPGFLSVSPLFPDLSLSSPSSSVPGICCSQRKTAMWKGCSTNIASSPLF